MKESAAFFNLSAQGTSAHLEAGAGVGVRVGVEVGFRVAVAVFSGLAVGWSSIGPRCSEQAL